MDLLDIIMQTLFDRAWLSKNKLKKAVRDMSESAAGALVGDEAGKMFGKFAADSARRVVDARGLVVCPGFIETPHGLREVKDLTALGVDVSEDAIRAAQGRLGKPEDIARAALYLASDDAEFVNGAQLFVDNCFSAV